MKAYEVYLRIHEKALEVGQALSAALIAAGREDLRWTPNSIVDTFRRDNRLVVEAEIVKDPRRHVKVLYADYCGLRDELIKLLQSDMGAASQVKPLKIELELPDVCQVQWSEMEGDTLHLCISVTDRAAQK